MEWKVIGIRDKHVITEGRSPGRATNEGGLELSEKAITSVLYPFLHARYRYLAAQ